MDRINWDLSGGFPIYGKDFDFQIEGNGGLEQSMVKVISGLTGGVDCIVYGCDYIDVSRSVSEGWVFLGGKLVKVDAHTATNDGYAEIISTTTESRLLKTGVYSDIYTQERVTFSATGGTLQIGNPVSQKTLLYKIQTPSKFTYSSNLYQGGKNAGTVRGTTYPLFSRNVSGSYKGNLIMEFKVQTFHNNFLINWAFNIKKNGTLVNKVYIVDSKSGLQDEVFEYDWFSDIGSSTGAPIAGSVYVTIPNVEVNDLISVELDGTEAANNLGANLWVKGLKMMIV